MTETTSSGIKLSFQTKGNYKYAKVPGISYRENGKIRKKGTIVINQKVLTKEESNNNVSVPAIRVIPIDSNLH